MKQERQHDGELEKSPVWDLLAADAAAHPVNPSPWFSTRTVAQACSQRQGSMSVLFRWLIPIPIAVLVALAFLPIHGFGVHNAYVSSDSEFESHMEFLSSSFD
jgi:hypothetical protein